MKSEDGERETEATSYYKLEVFHAARRRTLDVSEEPYKRLSRGKRSAQSTNV